MLSCVIPWKWADYVVLGMNLHQTELSWCWGVRMWSTTGEEAVVFIVGGLRDFRLHCRISDLGQFGPDWLMCRVWTGE